MAKFDPTALPPLPVATGSITLSDPQQPALADMGVTIHLAVQAGSTQALEIFEHNARLKERFLENGEQIPDPGRGHVPMSAALCARIAELMAADRSEEPMRVEEWAMLAHRAPNAFWDVCDLYNRLQAEANPPAPANDDEEAAEPENGVPGPLGNA